MVVTLRHEPSPFVPEWQLSRTVTRCRYVCFYSHNGNSNSKGNLNGFTGWINGNLVVVGPLGRPIRMYDTWWFRGLRYWVIQRELATPFFGSSWDVGKDLLVRRSSLLPYSFISTYDGTDTHRNALYLGVWDIDCILCSSDVLRSGVVGVVKRLQPIIFLNLLLHCSSLVRFITYKTAKSWGHTSN